MDIFEQVDEVIEREIAEQDHQEYQGYKKQLRKQSKKYLKIIRNQAVQLEIMDGNVHDLREHIISLNRQIDGLKHTNRPCL